MIGTWTLTVNIIQNSEFRLLRNVTCVSRHLAFYWYVKLKLKYCCWSIQSNEIFWTSVLSFLNIFCTFLNFWIFEKNEEWKKNPAGFWNSGVPRWEDMFALWVHLSKFSSSRSGRGKFGVRINGTSTDMFLRSAIVCVMVRSYSTSSIKQDMNSFFQFWILFFGFMLKLYFQMSSDDNFS